MSARRAPWPRAATVAIAGAVVAGLVAGCAPDPVTAEGRQIGTLYWIALWIGIAIVALVWGLGIFAVLRYRRPHDTSEPTQVRGDVRLEAVWTIIPLGIVLGLFVGTFLVLDRTEAQDPNPAARVEVTAFRWGWTFRYPDEGIEVSGTGRPGPEVVVPVGRPVRFYLQAADVIHSFYVPLFLFKRDLIPGRENVFEVTIQEPGTYAGQCAEYCGIGHSAMPFTVRAVTEAEYAAWLEAARASSPPGSPSAISGEVAP